MKSTYRSVFYSLFTHAGWHESLTRDSCDDVWTYIVHTGPDPENAIQLEQVAIDMISNALYEEAFYESIDKLLPTIK
jgi:hypothetical protein